LFAVELNFVSAALEQARIAGQQRVRDFNDLL
jgi:hypothetical protein